MFQFMRSFMSSKVGVGIALAFLALIAISFAGGDIANTGSFGGSAGGNRVATVGKEQIDLATLNQAANSSLERVRQTNPTVSMQVFLAQGGLEDVLDNLIDRLAIAAFGRQNSIVASDRLIDSEIAQIQAFHGADGKFSQEIFRQAIAQRGISEATLRDDIGQGLIAQQVLVPATAGSIMPRKMVTRYASLLNETRKGEVAVLPSAVFASGIKPTDKDIAAYYQANRDDFIRPERRVIRYATFGPEVFAKAAPQPTEAEITARYNANKAQYAASESRVITQVILPTQAAAKALADEVAKGATLEAAAKSKGLAASRLAALSRPDLTRQFSQGVADAVFAAGANKIAAPAKSALGWHVIRVDEIANRPARTLDQVRGELKQTLAAEKQRAAVSEALEKIESEIDGGTGLADVAKRLGVEVKSTPSVTANGQVYMKSGEQVPAIIAPVLSTAFTMDAEEPQMAEVERGKTFAIFDVTDIAESAPAPLKEIRDNVRDAYIRDKASAKAKAAAIQVQKAIASGRTMQQALAALKLPLPPVQPVDMSRAQLAQMQQQMRGDVPRPIALLFNMAKGTVKVQEGPGDMAWFVVSLTDIEPGKADNAQLVEQVRGEMGRLLGREYTDALGRAIRNEVGVKRNENAIQAVRKQLAGES